MAAAKAQHALPWVDALGFSNGANTLAAGLLTHGPIVRKAVLLRAMVTLPPAPGVNLAVGAGGVGVLLISGDRDTILPLDNAKRLADQLREAGAEVRHEVLRAGHELTADDLALATAFLR